MKKINLIVLFILTGIIGVFGQIKVNSSGRVDIDGGGGSFSSSAPRISINSTGTLVNSINTGLSLFNENTTNNTWLRLNFASKLSDGSDMDFVALCAQYKNHTNGQETGDFVIATTYNGVYSEKFRLTGNGKVGIGTTNPAYGKLQINGDGNANGLAIYAGTGSTFRIFRSGNTAYITRGGSTTAGLIITTDGHVGINRTPSTSYWLDVNGTIRANNVITTWTNDPFLKSNNYKTLDNYIESLQDLNGVSCNLTSTTTKDNNQIDIIQKNGTSESVGEIYNSNNVDSKARIQIGFIPDELKKVFPELVYADENGNIGIDYISLIPILVEAYKQQRGTIESLKEDVERLKVNSKSDDKLRINDMDVRLYQNTPNPFNENTEIRYYLPKDTHSASLYIYDMQGSQIKGINIHQRGYGSEVICSSELEAGMYIYALVANGKEIDTKRMVLTK